MIDLLIRNFYHTLKFLDNLNIAKVNIFDHKISDILNFFHEMVTEFYVFSDMIEERTDPPNMEEVMVKMTRIYIHISSIKTALITKVRAINPTYVFNEESNAVEKVRFSKDAQTMTEQVYNAGTGIIYDVSNSFIDNLNVTVGNVTGPNKSKRNASNENTENNNNYLDTENFEDFEITAALNNDLLKKDLDAQKQFMFLKSVWGEDETPLKLEVKEAETVKHDTSKKGTAVVQKDVRDINANSTATEKPHVNKACTDHDNNTTNITKDKKVTKKSSSKSKKSDIKNTELDKPKNDAKAEVPPEGGAKMKKGKNKKAKKGVNIAEEHQNKSNAKDIEMKGKEKTGESVPAVDLILPTHSEAKKSQQDKQNNNKSTSTSEEKAIIADDQNIPVNIKKNNLKDIVFAAMVECYPYGEIEVIDKYVLTASSLTSKGITTVAYTINAWNTVVTTVENKGVYYCCCCGLTIIGNKSLEEHLEDMSHYAELKSCTTFNNKETANFCRTVTSELIHCSICDIVYHEKFFYDLHTDHAQELERAMQLARVIKAKSA